MSACGETAGFLFQHPCGGAAQGVCADCDKPICAKHTKALDDARLCVACAKLQLEGGKPGLGKQARRAGPETYGAYADDPYFYSYSYYAGYGDYRRGRWGHEHYAASEAGDDPVDFTEADGEAFQVEADEDFETDMGGS